MKRPTLILGMAFFSLFAIPLLAYSPGIYAQEKKRICATMEVHERLLKTIPAYRDSRLAIENLTRSYLLREVLRTEIVKIPVVVHVVYNTPEQNISDDQIKSQIRILNEDYRKLNGDVSTVPSVFQTLVTDAKLNLPLLVKILRANLPLVLQEQKQIQCHLPMMMLLNLRQRGEEMPGQGISI